MTVTYQEFCATRGIDDYSHTTNALVCGGQEDLLCTCAADWNETAHAWDVVKDINDCVCAVESGEVPLKPAGLRYLSCSNWGMFDTTGMPWASLAGMTHCPIRWGAF